MKIVSHIGSSEYSDRNTPPDLSIAIEKKGEDFVIHIGAHSQKIAQRDINVANLRLYKAADRLAQLVFSGSVTPSQAIECLLQLPQGLAIRGYLTRNDIFSEETQNEIRKYLENCGQFPPRVEIASSDFLVPWEWFYDEDPSSVEESAGLRQIANNFWGFNRIIGRRPMKENAPRSHPQPARLLRENPRVAFIWDSNLKFVDEELAFLEQLDRENRIGLVLFDEWQHVRQIREIPPLLNSFLMSDDWDIVHFACHAEPGDDEYESYIQIGEAFRYEKSFLNWHPQVVGLNNPLVFFNACTTRSRSPYHTYDFISEFWDRGASNVIAVESLVSSSIARDFAIEFYTRLLDGDSVGLSVYEARHALMDRAAAPIDLMALFYAIYANPFTWSVSNRGRTKRA